ncbi:type II toxin-antitoxin system Phd/YefM family antitoxin [Mannheimia indoligenes]|uniref:type II toxin-antitoxin system Phd/YefM family antitoxin n=1 Tax=Mannheimia indoligenes TaxID=3103145 RepID=UPI002FE6199D
MYAPIEIVNIHEAKTHLSRIVEDVKKFGKPMIIAKAGKAQVKIVPLDDDFPQKRFGFMKQSSCKIPDNFDRLYENEIAEMFSGESK